MVGDILDDLMDTVPISGLKKGWLSIYFCYFTDEEFRVEKLVIVFVELSFQKSTVGIH